MTDFERRTCARPHLAARTRARLQAWRRLLAAWVLMLLTPLAFADIPRTADGRPDLSGTYDVATLTPLQRPQAFGDNLFLTPEQAERMQAEERALMASGQARSDPNRDAPPVGGDGSTGAAGNVGGYNTFWIDRGDSAILIDGKFRTSIADRKNNGSFSYLPQACPAVQQRPMTCPADR